MYVCVCVCGWVGGGPVTSFKVNFQGGSNICYPGGGEGRQAFSKGVESNC